MSWIHTHSSDNACDSLDCEIAHSHMMRSNLFKGVLNSECHWEVGIYDVHVNLIFLSIYNVHVIWRILVYQARPSLTFQKSRVREGLA